jgi:deoxyribonuclease-1-like protein
VVNFHSRLHDKNPEGEILAITDYFKKNPSEHPIILAGDFNVDEKELVFEDLKTVGYRTLMTNQRTTLKHDCDRNNYLNYAIDNIFYSENISKVKGATIDFVKVCENLESARTLSDHLPVFFKFSLQ